MNQAELFYSEVCRRTEEQYKTRQHFDTVAVGVLGFSGVLLSLTPFVASKWSDYSIYPIITICIAFIAIAVSTVFGLWLRNWEFQPNLSELAGHIESLEYENEALVLWSAKWMSDAVANNKRPLRIKAICLRVAYTFLSIEALSLITIYSLGVYLCP
ncbi:MAG: hypothetical protein JXA51_06625 [Dehalococcoidales bacterium]|nr:hypothetical protein [Dehalococcoidales bacterium]